jgi:cyclic pyranopterin phosphate synthase
LSRSASKARAPSTESAIQTLDRLGRPLKSLRLSLIDMCNLRCDYCMPEEEYVWLPRADMLSVDELERLVGVFTSLGVDKVRLTGGEPLMRREVELLARHAGPLARAGLDRITVSLDTLRPERFKQLTRRDDLHHVIRGIEAAREAGLRGTKINTVVIRGYNDDELVELIEFGRRAGAEVRFIEYMDVGGATRWSLDRVVSRHEMLERLAERLGPIQPLGENGSAPASRYALADGTLFGIIASTTEPFCRTCDRSRVTADGVWLLCLYAARGVDLRTPLREGASAGELRQLIVDHWTGRDDRGAEERARLNSLRGPLYQIEDLRQDPHREMHTRGG